MNGELLAILAAIERDKGINRDILIQAVEAALSTAAKKSLGAPEEQDVVVTLNRESGQLEVRADDQPIKLPDFSRIAAQTAKQVIIQKIREAEREVIFEEYSGRVGDIVTGNVHRFERGDIIVEVGRAEAVLPKTERIPHEDYRQGEGVQGYVLEVRKAVKGPSIVLSRVHDGFLQGLFALEVPEIAEGIVEIRGIAREPGDRTKIAVSSNEEKVDCVGACVGMRGTRVKNIVRELHGEKIDIIRWHDEAKEFIAAALSPAKIAGIQEDAKTKEALVIVEDDQLSLAIGKRGQNVRLASKLTGWELEIKSRTQLALGAAPVDSLAGLEPSEVDRLREAQIETVYALASSSVDQLSGLEGINEERARALIELADDAMEASPVQAEARPVEEGQAVEGAAEAGTPAEQGPGASEGAEQVTEQAGEAAEETAAARPDADPAAEATGSDASEAGKVEPQTQQEQQPAAPRAKRVKPAQESQEPTQESSPGSPDGEPAAEEEPPEADEEAGS